MFKRKQPEKQDAALYWCHSGEVPTAYVRADNWRAHTAEHGVWLSGDIDGGVVRVQLDHSDVVSLVDTLINTAPRSKEVLLARRTRTVEEAERALTNAKARLVALQEAT